MSSTGKHTQLVSGFSPLNFPGCSLWLDAITSNNFALTGTNITTWYDKSPFSNHASNVAGGSPVLSNASINGRASVFFSNAPSIGGSLTLGNRGVAGFMVIRPLVASRGTDQRIFSAAIPGQGDWSAASRFLVGVQQNTTQIWYNRYNASIPKTNFNASNNYIISWTYDGTVNSLYLNGANADVAQDVAMNDTFGSTLYRLGNQVNVTTETYSGFIGEVIVYDDFLLPAQRQAVEGYLAWKWGIEPDLGITFSPLTSLPSCAVWFDGADSTAFTLSGSNITQWRDKAGSNVTTNIGTPVYVSNAVGGVPGVRLDVNSGFKISPMSNGANTTTVSIYGVVAASNTMQSNARIFTSGRVADGQVDNDSTATYAWTLYQASSATPTLVFGHASSTINASNTLSNGVPCLISAVFSGTTVNLWANGSNQGSINTTNTLTFNRLGIGKNTNPDAGTASNAWAGNVGEFLVFYAAHTEAQRLQVESYLASKWNIRTRAPQNLVPTHSYAKTVPFLRSFQPTDVPGCEIWMDAADSNSFTFSSGSNISLWRDKSGRGFNFATTQGAPTYASNAVTFAGTTFMRSVSQMVLTGSHYAMIATKLNTGGCMLFAFDTTILAMGGDFSIRYFNDVLNPVNSGDFASPYIVNGTSGTTFSSNICLARHIVEGRSQSSGTTFVTLSSSLANRYFLGDIYEVLLYSTTPSVANRLLIQSYLAEKWGIRGAMGGPAHPFRYGPPMGITPRSTPTGCSLWLDAADTTTLTLSGSNVTAWRDKSGLTTLPLIGTPPTYVSNQVRFNASGRFQGAYTMTTQTMVFAVYSTTNTTTNARLITGDGSNGYGNVHAPVGTDNDLFVYTGGGPGYYTTLTPQTGLRLYTIGFNGSNTAVWRNGSAATMAGTAANATATGANIAIGASVNGDNPWTGELSELILFNTSLTTTERQQIEGYLADKWGLSSSLPVEHPYRSGPQTGITPATVPGLRLWLDSADASSYTLSGSNLTAITDKSPFAWALGTPTNFTVNSTKFNTTYPSFFATGTGQLGVNSNFILAQPLTVYFAGQATTANSSTFLFDGTTSDRVVIYQGSTMFAGGSEFSPTNSGAATSSHVISAVYNGSSSSMRLNGITTTGTVGSTGFGGIRISGRNTGGDGYAGHICELVICSGAHTTAQRQQMEGYLSWKWGIPFRLPGPISTPTALSRPLNVDFDPRSVGGCAVWFDAADSGVIRFASGSNIARWLDKSGVQNHLATNSSNQGFWPTYTSNTLNGKPVVTFSNAAMIGSYASPTSTTPHTIFVVARPSAITGLHDLFQVSSFPDGGTTGVGVNLAASYSSNKWFAGSLYGGNDGDVTSNTVASTSRTDIVVGTVWPGSNINTTVNGTTGLDSGQVTSSLNTKANGARTNMGAHWYPPENYYREFYFGYIAEVLAFSKALTVADRQRIEGYLAWKWGLQSQLPALHPYSNVKF